jgi:hypothetical protein
MRDRRKIRTLGSFCLLWLLIPGAVGQEASVRFPISSERVAQAIVAAGVPITAAQVRFLTDVSALGQDSGLEVINMAKWLGDTWKVELRCSDQRVCLPFYVLVEAGTPDAFDRISIPRRGLFARRDIPRLPRKQILVRNGERATLVFENPSVRITMPVICLESGDRGQTIRVVSTDHKRFLKGEIVEPGLLKVEL